MKAEQDSAGEFSSPTILREEADWGVNLYKIR
jgi:hypothetical protein